MPKRVLTTARSMEWCRNHGWRVGKVEMRNPGALRTHDLFGWIDLIAFDGYRWIAIQCCTMDHRTAHLDKMRADPEILGAIRDWLKLDYHRAEVWAWRKTKVKRGGKAVRWSFEVTDLSPLLADSGRTRALPSP